MTKTIGLWIDHRESVIVTLADKADKADKKDEITRLESDMEKHVQFSGGASKDTAEDTRDRRFNNHLNTYYDKVIAAIRDADSILILGPGEAKVELKSRMDHDDLGGRVVGVETVDKMTDHQIAAMVRKHFHHPN